MIWHSRWRHTPFLFMSLAVGAAIPGSNAAWPAEADDTTRFVAADVVKLRDAPSREGKIIANLRINRRVIIMPGDAAPPGWAKVSVDISPSLEGHVSFVVGYVASAYLGTEMQTADALRAVYDAHLNAGDLAGAKTAAERLVALEPGKTEHVESLKGLYRQLGDEAGVRRLDDYLAGLSPKFIAYCSPGSAAAILLAEYQPGRGIVPLLPTIHEGSLRRKSVGTLNRLRLRLQRGPLFKFAAGKSILLDNDYLLRANVVPAPTAGGNLVEHVAVGSARLGLRDLSCNGDRRILSNEPMKSLRAEPIEGKSVSAFTRDLRGKEFIRDLSVTAQRLPGGKPLISVEIKPQLVSPYKGPSNNWRLFDGATGGLLFDLGFYFSFPDADRERIAATSQVVYDVQWFGWERSEVRVGLVHYGTSLQPKSMPSVLPIPPESSGAYKNGAWVLLIIADEQGIIHQQDLVTTWPPTKTLPPTR